MSLPLLRTYATTTVALLNGTFARLYPDLKTQRVDLSERNAIVTGSNVGLGLEAALELARMGARVILACRNQEKAQAAREQILEAVPKAQIEVWSIDTSDNDSVRAFAEKWAKQEPASKRRLDILINNAGALSNAKATSKQGHEFTYATNVLGAFVLTLSLLRFMPENARVVWTSSIALLGAYPVRPDNLDDQAYLGSLREGKRYPVTHALQLYMNSKASMALLSRVLAKRLKSPGIVSLAVNPGAVRTSIWRRPGYGDVSISALGARWIDVIGIRPQQGGQPLVFAAVDPSAAALSGQYLDRNVPRWMPWWHDDVENDDAVFAQVEKDAGITLEQALKQK